MNECLMISQNWRELSHGDVDAVRSRNSGKNKLKNLPHGGAGDDRGNDIFNRAA